MAKLLKICESKEISTDFLQGYPLLTWIKIAVRNIFKNRRRSFYTVLAIALGYAAVSVFGGFTEYIFKNLKYSSIYVHGDGHLTIFKKGFLTEGQLHPADYLLTESELEAIREVCKSYPQVLLVTPKLQITGLISNGNVSTVFFANGVVPSDIDFIHSRLTGMLAKVKFYDGKDLEDNVIYGVGLSSGLSEKLNLPIGSQGTAMTVTVNGMVNALDIEVFQTFESAMEALNDKLMNVPLQFAQSLYDTTSVDRVSILLNKDDETGRMNALLEKKLNQKGLQVEIKTWDELSPFYRKVKDMFSIIFLFIFVIVFVIVVMSIINTISMSVMERTREIGTLRSLGLKRSGIIRLFGIESAMLGIMGSAFGVVLTIMSWTLVKVLKPTWIPPQMTRRVFLEVYLVPDYMVASLVCLVLLSILAAMFPARKAAYQSIVDALGHV